MIQWLVCVFFLDLSVVQCNIELKFPEVEFISRWSRNTLQFFYMVFLYYSFNKYAYVFLWRLKNGQKVFCTHCATNDNQFRWKEKILLQCILNCYNMTIALVKVFVGHYSLNSHMGLYMLHCLCPMVKEKKTIEWEWEREMCFCIFFPFA